MGRFPDTVSDIVRVSCTEESGEAACHNGTVGKCGRESFAIFPLVVPGRVVYGWLAWWWSEFIMAGRDLSWWMASARYVRTR